MERSRVALDRAAKGIFLRSPVRLQPQPRRAFVPPRPRNRRPQAPG